MNSLILLTQNNANYGNAKHIQFTYLCEEKQNQF